MKNKPIMRRYINIIFFITIFVLSPSVFSQNIIDQAKEAYTKKDYNKSIQLYETIISNNKSTQQESPEIYYNLGNSYFRTNNNAKAIVNYERALLLNPSDEDIIHNLKFVRQQIKDKIDTSDSMLIKRITTSIQNLFTSNQWASIAVILFVIVSILIVVFIFTSSLSLKRNIFYSFFALFTIILISNIFSFNQKNKILDRQTAIVMSSSVSVMNSPNIEGKELFTLHEGTKIKIKGEENNWFEIEFENGGVGWLPENSVEKI